MAAEPALGERRDHIHRKVNSLPGGDEARKGYGSGGVHALAAVEQEPVCTRPTAAAGVLEAPGLGEGGAGGEERAIRDGDIGDEGGPVTTGGEDRGRRLVEGRGGGRQWREGCERGGRRGGLRGTGPHDARRAPESAVQSGRAGGVHSQDEADPLPGQPAEIDIGAVETALIGLFPGPERLLAAGGSQVIHAESDIAAARPELTIDQGLEAVALLDLDLRIDGLQPAIELVLRDGEQPGRGIERPILQVRAAYLKGIAPTVAAGAGEGQDTLLAAPDGIGGIGDKIEDDRTDLDHVDVHPEGLIPQLTDPELRAGGVGKHPEPPEMPALPRSSERDRDIHRIAGGDSSRKIHGCGCAEGIASREDQPVGGGPGAGAGVQQAPGLGEGGARRKGGPIRDAHIGDELERIAGASRLRRRNGLRDQERDEKDRTKEKPPEHGASRRTGARGTGKFPFIMAQVGRDYIKNQTHGGRDEFPPLKANHHPGQ